MSRHSVHFMSDSLPVAGAKRSYRLPSRFAQHVAPHLNMKPASVEQMVHGYFRIQDRFAVLVAGALTLGDAEMHARLMGPVEMAQQTTAPLPYTTDLLLRAVEADANEDMARELWLVHQTPANLDAWRRAITTERGSKLDLLRSDLMPRGDR